MEKAKKSTKRKILSILGIVAIVILSTILVLNVTIMIKGTVNKDEPPSIFGRTPLVVLSGSMDGDEKDSFGEGALIFVKDVDAKDLKEGDIIAFFDPASKKNSIVTHRVVEIITPEGEEELSFWTKGDANTEQDKLPVKASAIIGRYTSHIEGVGHFALFLQKPIGMLLFIGVPVLSFIIYDLTRRKLAGKKKDKKTEELEAEIERLKALANLNNEQSAETIQTQAENSNQEQSAETIQTQAESSNQEQTVETIQTQAESSNQEK